MHHRLLRAALGAALFVSLAGCSEQVTGSLGCPELCSDQSAQLKDTLLTASVILDTTFVGFPRLGVANNFTLVGQGDTADVRLVARFDTLVSTYRATGAATDSTITRVDSAALIFVRDTTFAKPAGPVRLEAFDVDTTANDTIPRTLLPLFRADRSLGARTFTVAELTDTVRLSRATAPFLRYRVSADTTVPPDTVQLVSSTPSEPSIAAGLGLYPVIATPTVAAPPSSLLAVGGLAGARTYMQFAIPPIVLDSVTVLRATIELTQRPSRSPGIRADTIGVITHPVVAGPAITDLFTASQFLGSSSSFRINTLRLAPRDSGRREVEIVDLIRTWRALGTTNTPRSVVLRTDQEGESAGEIDFFSNEAPANLRPVLRLTYVPRRGFGLP